MMNNFDINNNDYIDIINDFRNLIDFINYNDVLIEKMFHIFEKYFEFNCAGIFFNSPDIYCTNTLNLLIKNKNINNKLIEQNFFKNMNQYKQIIKTKVNIISSNIISSDEGEHFEDELIIPFLFQNTLLGGICIVSQNEILKTDINTYNFLINEFLSIFKLKYLYSEQIFKSSVDGLTGLYNRHQFDINLNQECNRSQRYNAPFTLAMIDIDHFKNINDTYGHQFGDFVLKEISKIIQNTFRKTDIVFRYGGEEITIIMPETNSENAILPLEKLRKKIKKHNFNGKNVTVSIGAADFNNDIKTSTDILKKADEMLYTAKENGRNQVKVFLPSSH